MDRFNTGNALNSADERDLFDNSMNFDVAMNSTAKTFTDRFGVEKPTIDYALKSTGFMPAGFDFVTGGVLRPGDRNKCVYNPAPNGDNNWYRWNGAFPKEIAPNSQPNPKDENNWVLAHFRIGIAEKEALRRTYLEVGLNLVEGSFEQGGTLQSVTDVLLEEKTGKVYSWTGSFPKEISPNTLPGFDVLFLDKTQSSLLSILKGPDGKGQSDVYYGGGWTGLDGSTGNIYNTAYDNNNNAIKIRYDIPETDNQLPVVYLKKTITTTRDTALGGKPGRWDEGNIYSHVTKLSGTAFAAGITSMFDAVGGSGDSVSIHARANGRRPNIVGSQEGAGVWGLWSFAVATPSDGGLIKQLFGLEIDCINNGQDIPFPLPAGQGGYIGSQVTALNGACSHGVEIGASLGGSWHRGLFIRQGAITPSNLFPNTTAIEIEGGVFGKRIGGIKIGKGYYDFGVSFVNSAGDFVNNAAIILGDGNRIYAGDTPSSQGNYMAKVPGEPLWNFQNLALAINGEKVVGPRVKGISALSGNGSGESKNTETITLIELARYVKKISDAIFNHGLIGN